MAATRDEAGMTGIADVRIPSEDGDAFDAAVATPSSANGCAVIVLQEIFGVTRKIRRYCGMFASQGYLAVAPDMFWRIERGVNLSYGDDDVKRALGYLERFDEERGLDDVRACATWLRDQGARRIGVVGFCFGGKLAALCAWRGDADAAIAFYPAGIEHRLDALRAVKHPLQLHFAANDPYVPAAVVSRIEAAVSPLAHVESHVYPDAGHAFFRPDLEGWASASAWQRTLAFLQTRLRAEPPAAGGALGVP